MKKLTNMLVILGIIVAVMGFFIWLPVDNVEENNMDTETTDKVDVEIITEGEGRAIVDGDSVFIYYTGTLSNGAVFDSTEDGSPAEFVVSADQLIQGFYEGLLGLKAGSKAKITIPSDLAYGETGTPTIPPNSDLYFEVEIVEIKIDEPTTETPDDSTTSLDDGSTTDDTSTN